ncbi:MAG TPA: hypothetical protein VIH93_12880 [Thermoanaerobaculia bacterium]|jgi:hypothetical protein
MSTPQTVTRPPGVTALGAFFACGALASGLSVASLLTPGGPLEPIWQVNPRAHEAFARMGAWALLLLGAVCLACAASAYGFLRGRPWGYWLGITLLLVDLAGNLLNAALGIEPRAVIGLPVVALLLWYLSTPRVRGFFAPAGGTPTLPG